MNNSIIEKQTKELAAHINDYQRAYQLKKKGEAAIFDKHKLPDGQFGAGLRDDLIAYRKNFAQEWGYKGWRNEQFVKKQMEEAMRPTEEQVNDMHEQEVNQNDPVSDAGNEFLKNIRNNSQRPGNRQGPRLS